MPLDKLAEYTDALTEVFAAPRHARHLVCTCLGRHAACAADSGHARRRPWRRRREDARHCRRSQRASAPLQGRLQRRAWRRPVPWRMGSQWQFGPAINSEAFRAIKQKLDPIQLCSTPARSLTRRAWTMARCSALRHRVRPSLTSASRWCPCSTGPPGMCRPTPIRRGDHGARQRGGNARAASEHGRRDVQQQWPLPQVRRRHHVLRPSYRVTRNEQDLTRGRANTLRLALSRSTSAPTPSRASPWPKRWICASAAKAASATARPALTWPR